MMKRLFFVFLGLLVLNASPVLAESNSIEELLKNLKKACRENSFEQFRGLYLWEGVDGQMTKMSEAMIREVLKQPVWKVDTEGLDKNDKTEHILNGYKYSPNVPLEGHVKISHDEKRPFAATLIPYGISGGKYYLANTKKEKVEGNVISQKQYSISVWGMSGESGLLTFEGSAVYYLNGEKQIRDLNGEHNIAHAFYGDYVEKCVVTKTSDGGFIQLTINEEGKPVFDSGEIKSNKKIEYKK